MFGTLLILLPSRAGVIRLIGALEDAHDARRGNQPWPGRNPAQGCWLRLLHEEEVVGARVGRAGLGILLEDELELVNGFRSSDLLLPQRPAKDTGDPSGVEPPMKHRGPSPTAAFWLLEP